MVGVTQIVIYSYYYIILTMSEKLLIFIPCHKRVVKDYDGMFVMRVSICLFICIINGIPVSDKYIQ